MSRLGRVEPTPRPGFTHVAQSQVEKTGPVVAEVEGSLIGLSVLRKAAEEATNRVADLHLLDSPTSPLAGLLDVDLLDADDSAWLHTMLASPHITIVTAPAEDLVGYGKRVRASMLVVGTPAIGDIGDVGSVGADILMVSQQDEESGFSVSPIG
jgi:hypothetical protein